MPGTSFFSPLLVVKYWKAVAALMPLINSSTEGGACGLRSVIMSSGHNWVQTCEYMTRKCFRPGYYIRVYRVVNSARLNSTRLNQWHGWLQLGQPRQTWGNQSRRCCHMAAKSHMALRAKSREAVVGPTNDWPVLLFHCWPCWVDLWKSLLV